MEWYWIILIVTGHDLLFAFGVYSLIGKYRRVMAKQSQLKDRLMQLDLR